MTIQDIEVLIKEDQKKRGIPEWNHTEGHVDYEMAAWLFDMKFNEPCDTYFHNVDDFADYPKGTPEHSQWEGREDNWEMCGSGKFINYPDNFVIRYRYARPTYAQVLHWFEKEYGASIRFDKYRIEVKNLTIRFGDRKHQATFFIRTGYRMDPNSALRSTMNAILARLWLFGYNVPTMPDHVV